MEEKVVVSDVSRSVRMHKKPRLAHSFAESLLQYFPNLKKKLALAAMPDHPSAFLEKVVISTIYISLGFALLLAAVFNIFYVSVFFSIAAFPLILAVVFSYLMLYPEAKTIRRQREIDAELVFAGRHVLIALRAGMPLFDCLVGTSSGYGAVSEEFRKIIDKVNLGVPMGQAIREAGTSSPSRAFSRITMQLTNAISSGADVASSLEVVLNQVAREQAIALKAYGQKLNPLMMFFMIFGIVFPSLGIAFAIILLSLVSGGVLGITPVSLLYITLVIGLVQLIFLSIIESARPKYVM